MLGWTDGCIDGTDDGVFVGCTDRGELLGRVRRAHAHYLHELLERIRTLEATERERELQRLRAEVDALSAKLGICFQKGRQPHSNVAFSSY